MPYKLVKSGDGYIVTNSETGRKHSTKPLPRSRAVAQMRALYAAEPGASTKAFNYGAKVGQTIAGHLVRAAGGRFGSADASADPAKTQADAAATIAQNRATNAAAAKPGGRKHRVAKPRKPRKAHAKKPHKGHVAKPHKAHVKRPRSASGKRRDLKRQQMHHARVAKALGLMEDAAGSLLDLAQGKKVTDDGGLESMGLAVAQTDGTYKLTAAGEALAKAADAGDVKGARTIMDAISTKEAAPIIPVPMVFKDKNDRWRWVTFSSTAYRDRDGEIVSTKALADDVARADADGQYGPLRWWHVPGVDIGDCDFNAMTGRVLVESGTFRDERIGARIKAAAPDLQVSIGFHHAPTEPVDGVFSSIRRFERSLLPAGRASNPYTRLLVQETPSMDQPKQDALKSIVGDDLLAQLLTQADATTKAADAAGVAFKEAEPAAELAVDDMDDEGIAVGDMSPEEFGGLLKASNQPLADALGMLAQAITGTTTKAAAVETRLAEVETKAAKTEATAAVVPSLQTELETTKAALAAAQAQIAELKGDLPKSVNERRASQSAATVLTPEQTAQYKSDDAQPRGDPNFINSFVLGQPVQQGA